MMAKKILTDKLSEPLKGATTAMIDINPGDGNLTIDSVTGNDQVLANGMLEYIESKGLPIRSLNLLDNS